jgi:NMD protein affecting ribosome stability and mRNA decay
MRGEHHRFPQNMCQKCGSAAHPVRQVKIRRATWRVCAGCEALARENAERLEYARALRRRPPIRRGPWFGPHSAA